MNPAGHLLIYMEYCEHGDVHTFLQEAKKARQLPDENSFLAWFVQISLALHALHSKRILHRDLKTQNIFITGRKDENVLALKLGDFGIATVLSSTLELAKTQIGTPFYMSPELINNKPYSYKSDIWGLGCVLYEIINGQRAFDAQGLNGLALKIIRGHYTPITSSCSPSTRSLIKSMLNKNPKLRPTLGEILHLDSIRPRIPVAHRSVIQAAPEAARVVIEQALGNQLASLGLGALVNCPSHHNPRNDRRSVAKRLERARKRKRRVEEQHQRTAALLAECLTKLPEERDDCASAVSSLLRNSDFWYSTNGCSPELMPSDYWDVPAVEDEHAMSQRDRILRKKERRREEAQRRFEEEARKIREENLAQQRAWAYEMRDRKQDSSSPEDYLEDPQRRFRHRKASMPSIPVSARDRQSDPGEPTEFSQPRQGRRAVRRSITKPLEDSVPPATLYEEPLPPHGAPLAPSGKRVVDRRPAEVPARRNNARLAKRSQTLEAMESSRLPARQQMPHSACLDSGLNVSSSSSFGRKTSFERRPSYDRSGFERRPSYDRNSGSSVEPHGWGLSDDSVSSGSFSEVDELDVLSEGSHSDWDRNRQRRQRALQQRIDECRSAIYKHRATIAMLQYSASQDNEVVSSHVPPPMPRRGTGGDSSAAFPQTSDDEGSSAIMTQHKLQPGPAPPPFVRDFAARLQRRCLEGLGAGKLRAARHRLRAATDAAETPEAVRVELLELLGLDKIGFLSLLDQLVHLERRWGAQDAS
jgi:serine/threonine protein kinase